MCAAVGGRGRRQQRGNPAAAGDGGRVCAPLTHAWGGPVCRGRALGEAGVPCEPSAAPGTRPPLPEGQGDRLQGCLHPRTPVPSPRSPGLLLPCLQLVPGAPHRKTPSRGLKSLCRPDALDLGNAPCARWALLLPACRPLCSSNSGAKPQSPRLLPSGTPRLAVPPPPRPLGLEAEEGGGRSVAEAIRAVLQDTDSAVPPSLLCPSVPPLSLCHSSNRKKDFPQNH